MSNKPYVKQFDENGFITNPITEANPYLHKGANRSSRREPLQSRPFIGNGKQFPLAILGKFKYHKYIQVIETQKGTKRINHYKSV